MVGVTLSGPVYGAFMKSGLQPRHGFGLMALLALGLAAVLRRALAKLDYKED